MPAYDVGRRIYLLELENADIERRINQVFSKLSKDQPPDQTSLKTRLEDLRRQRAQIENQIIDIESNFFRRL
jgi:polyhydroxyalkanoate synthesis regulator phasin